LRPIQIKATWRHGRKQDVDIGERGHRPVVVPFTIASATTVAQVCAGIVSRSWRAVGVDAAGDDLSSHLRPETGAPAGMPPTGKCPERETTMFKFYEDNSKDADRMVDEEKAVELRFDGLAPEETVFFRLILAA
jgi:hypothetical protein